MAKKQNPKPGPRPMTKSDIPGFVAYWANEMHRILKLKGDISEEEKTYLMEKLETMKDEKLKNIIIGLFGWGDDERGIVECYVAITVELLRKSTPRAITEAAQTVEMRSLLAHLPTHPSLTESKNCVIVDSVAGDTE